MPFLKNGKMNATLPIIEIVLKNEHTENLFFAVSLSLMCFIFNIERHVYNTIVLFSKNGKMNATLPIIHFKLYFHIG